MPRVKMQRIMIIVIHEDNDSIEVFSSTEAWKSNKGKTDSGWLEMSLSRPPAVKMQATGGSLWLIPSHPTRIPPPHYFPKHQ
jgi:hypothetical protein